MASPEGEVEAPASAAQRRLWAAEQMTLGTGAYNVPSASRLRGPLDSVVLGRALNAVVRRHEVLRTRLELRSGQVTQVIQPHLELMLEEHDLRTLRQEAFGVAVEHIEQEAKRPFDLARCPLLRASIYLLGEDDHVLHVTAHHAICDLESLKLLLGEVTECYAADLEKREAQLPQLPIQYLDYALWEREAAPLRRPALAAYWRRKLADCEFGLELPYDRPRPSELCVRGARVERSAKATLGPQLRELCRRRRCSLFVLVLSALAVLLRERIQRRDLVIATSVAGRDRPELEPLIGPLLNVVPLRVRIDDDGTLPELLAATQQTVLEANGHAGLSIDELAGVLGLAPRPNESALQVALLVTEDEPDTASASVERSWVQVHTATAKNDLTILLQARPDGLEIVAEYASELFDASTVDRLLEQLIAVLECAVADPEASVDVLRSQIASGEAERGLTRNQVLIWAAQQIYPDAPIFDEVVLTRAAARLDPERFAAAFHATANASDAFRSTLVSRGGEAWRQVLPEAPGRLERIDLRGDRDAATSLGKLVEARRRSPLSLDRTLYESALVQTADDEFYWYLKVHQLLVDGWGLALFIAAVLEHYQRLAVDAVAPPPALRPFDEFVQHERALSKTRRYTRAQRYWEARLSAERDALCLYADNAIESVGEVARVRRTLDAPLVRQLREVMRAALGEAPAEVLTVQALCTALCAYLYRASGSRKLAIGLPMLNRPRRALREIVGSCMHVCPVHIDVDPGESLEELARAVQKDCFDALQYQSYASRNPALGRAFDVMLNYVTAPAQDAGVFDAPEHYPPAQTLGLFNLGAEAYANRLDLTLDFDFNVEMFSPSQQRDVVEHVLAALRALAARPEQSVGDIQFGPSASAMLRGPTRALPKESFVALFAATAQQYPDAVAVADASRRVNYADLHQEVLGCAVQMSLAGARQGDIVAVALPRSVELVTALLATLGLGSVYLPLDPEDPPERWQMLLQEANAGLVLTCDELADKARAVTQVPVVVPRGRDSRPLCFDLKPASSEQAPVYALFTSGSTGKPKCAVVEQAGMLNHLYAKLYEFDLGAGDVVAQTASQCFDISIWQMLAPLLVGGRVEVVSDDCVRDPAALVQALQRRRVTVLEVVPAYLRVLIAELQRREGAGALPQLRWLVVTGEALYADLCRAWFGLGLQAAIVNAYGPTECSDDVTHFTLTAAPGPNAEERVPIGFPICNTQLHVLDERLCPRPPGLPGELYVSGCAVGRGYIGSPEATARAFIDSPRFGRLYRTGDRVRMRDDGALVFLGRVDDQVKIRGARIEPGEVESCLQAHPDVRDAVVVAREDLGGEPCLVAYFVPEGREMASEELRGYLSERLSRFLVPAAFVTLQALPVNRSGKVERAKLPRPALAVTPDAPEGIGPRNEREATLLDVFAEVLRTPVAGVRSSLVELGGDSIQAIQIAARAGEFGIELTPRQVLENPTVEALAALEPPAVAVEAVQAPVVGRAPVTPIQRWFLEQGRDNPHHWNQSVVADISPRWTARHVEGAVEAVIGHHDALRLRFSRAADGAWHQRSGSQESPTPFAHVDLRGEDLGSEQLAARLEREADRIQRSLNIEEGPVVRVALIETGTTYNRIVIAAHHLVVDAVSLRIIGEDLARACERLRVGEAVELPPKTTSFLHWAQRLERADQWLSVDEVDFWRTDEERPAQVLPVDFPGGLNTELSARELRVQLPAPDTRALLDRLRLEGQVDVQDALLGCLAVSIARWSSLSSLTVNLESHGRDAPGVDLSRTVGWFTCVYPLSLGLAQATDAWEAVRKTAAAVRRVPSQGLGYEVARRLGVASGFGQVTFNYFGRIHEEAGDSLDVRFLAEGSGARFTPSGLRPQLLKVNAALVDGALQLIFEYSPNLHRTQTVAALAEQACGFLRGLGSGPREPSVQRSKLEALGLPDGAHVKLAELHHQVQEAYPLAPGQRAMLEQCVRSQAQDLCVVQSSTEAAARLQIGPLRQALKAIAYRHTIVRTSFLWEGLQDPLQVVATDAPIPLVVEDLSELSASAARRRVVDFVREDAALGFDLRCPPLMRVALHLLPGDRHHLSWTVHHLISDRWSASVLAREFALAYEAACRGEQAALPPAVPYRSFVEWLYTRDRSGDRAFWQSELKEFRPASRLGQGSIQAALQGPRAEAEVALPPTLVEAMQRLARSAGVTATSIYGGAWALQLGRCSEGKEVLFGVVSLGRPASLAGSQDCVGPFVNMLPCRIRLVPGAPDLAWLARVHASHVAARDHQWVTQRELSEWTGQGEEEITPESVLVSQTFAAAAAGRQGGDAGGRTGHPGRHPFPLLVEVLPSEARVSATFCVPYFSEAGVGRLLEGFVERLGELCQLAQYAVSARVTDPPSVQSTIRTAGQ